jgi:hypothetical protein
MIELIGDVAVKLATIVASHNPRYPVYIPIDIDNKEWVLGYGECGPAHEGFFIHREEEGLIRHFDDMFDLMGYLTYKSVVDWTQVLERITVAGMAVASIVKVHEQQIDDAFGDNFANEALPIREALEEAYLADPDKGVGEVKIKYLAKMLKVPEVEKKPTGLTIVKEEEK